MKSLLLTLSKYAGIITILYGHQGMAMEIQSKIQNGEDVDIMIPMSALSPITIVQNSDQPPENPDIIDGVNIEEDIPGCTDDCLRFTLKGLRICQVPIDFTAGLAALGSGILIGFSQISTDAEALLGNITSSNGTLTSFLHDINQNQNLKLAAVCLNVITAALIFAKLGVQHAILYDQAFLKQLVEDYHKKNM